MGQIKHFSGTNWDEWKVNQKLCFVFLNRLNTNEHALKIILNKNTMIKLRKKLTPTK